MSNATVQCPHCAVELAVPQGAAGRRLRCPSCQQIFQVGAAAAPAAKPARPAGESRPPSKNTGLPTNQRPASSQIPAPVFFDDIQESAPRGDAPLRDILDLPLLMDDPPAKRPSTASAEPNDALALFRDDPPPRKKALAGDARHKMRRCPTCGGVVPAGMSLCSTCGLDLDTGQRIDLSEDLEPVATGPRRQGMPISVMFVGGLSLIVALILSIAAFVGLQNGMNGAEFLIVIGLFSIYAAIEFLRMRSVKLLFVALTLGVMINVVALIGLPVFRAVSDVEVVDTRNGDDENPTIKPITEKLDINQVSWGIALVFAYAALSVYINSPPVKRHFDRR